LLGISIAECIVIVLVAFIAFGPKQLQQTARNMGRYWQQIQNMSSKIKAEFNQAVETDMKQKPTTEKRDDQCGGKR